MVSELTRQDTERFFDALDKGQPAPKIDFPRHVLKLLSHLRYRFVTGAGAADWDGYELMAYAPQCLRVRDDEETDRLFILLREAYTFRPSVANLRETIDKMQGYVAPPEPVPGHVADSRKVFKMPTIPESHRIEGTEIPLSEADFNPGRRRAMAVVMNLPGWKTTVPESREERERERRRAHGHHDGQEEAERADRVVGGMQRVSVTLAKAAPREKTVTQLAHRGLTEDDE